MGVKKTAVALEPIEKLIVTVRGLRVILAEDLGRIYGVPTKVLNQAVKRNLRKFPGDFLFRLTWKEAERVVRSRSQVVTLKRGANVKYQPYAFTEHGAIMAATVLKSKRAVEMSLFVVRAFIRMRNILTNNKELAKKLLLLERELKGRLNVHETAIVGILQRIMRLIDPPSLPEPPPKQKIGFRVGEPTAKYLIIRRKP